MMSGKGEPLQEKKKDVTIFVVIVNSKSEVLLVDNKEQYKADRDFTKQRKWGLPGGGAREGEGDSAAALREVDEETGLTIDMNTIQLMTYERKDGGHLVLVVSASVTDEDAPLRGETEDTWSAAWASISNLPFETYPKHLDYIEEVLKSTKKVSAEKVG